MREHLAISQFPSGAPVTKKEFPMRNRTMALISQATVIVEAGENSGVISQAWNASGLEGSCCYMNHSQGFSSSKKS
jgi:DNA processing protein